MLTVDEYGEIRRAHRDGMSIREIARRFHHSKRTVRKALARSEPAPYQRKQPWAKPKLGPFVVHIEAMLAADEQAPRKQRHTAAQVFRRLQAEHGYRGSYDQVRRFLSGQRRARQETFVPLVHDPGRRVEVDFGHLHVDFPEGRRLVSVLIVTWSYSNRPFALALPMERIEAILHGLVEAFATFGCVPHEVWWDNPKTVALEIGRGRQRKVQQRYAALASHYRFDPLFCMPRRGNEKPRVENRVYDLQRRWGTPVPTVADLAALNAHLQRCCDAEQERHVGGNPETVAQRWVRDRDHALALPAHPFDACVWQAGQADKYQTVAFDGNRYSVPRSVAFRPVTLKGYVDRVVVTCDGVVVAEHPRCYQRGQQLLDPLHYLAILGRKPAVLDHSSVYRSWALPPVFSALRAHLEERHGTLAGARQYIRVLQLLAEHPLERVQAAIAASRGPDVDQITQQVRRLALRASETNRAGDGCPEAVAAVRVPRPDLRQFDQLLNQGENGYV